MPVDVAGTRRVDVPLGRIDEPLTEIDEPPCLIAHVGPEALQRIGVPSGRRRSQRGLAHAANVRQLARDQRLGEPLGSPRKDPEADRRGGEDRREPAVKAPEIAPGQRDAPRRKTEVPGELIS